MKLTAFRDGAERLMAVVTGDTAEPLASVDEFYGDVTRWTDVAKSVTRGSLQLEGLRQVPAVPLTAKVLCVGLNYRAHAEEGGREVPSHPNIFARWASTLVADGEPVPLPAGEPRLDFEGELVAVVGARLHGADPAAATAAILGYAAGNDITARGYQQRTPQWALGKNADRSAPMGPIVTADEVGTLSELGIACRLNGREMQRSTLGRMVFPPGEIISYASGCLTLEPGDVVFTGTPEGVGFRRNPPVFMGDGDTVEVEIERVGTLTTRITGRVEGAT